MEPRIHTYGIQEEWKPLIPNLVKAGHPAGHIVRVTIMEGKYICGRAGFDLVEGSMAPYSAEVTSFEECRDCFNKFEEKFPVNAGVFYEVECYGDGDYNLETYLMGGREMTDAEVEEFKKLQVLQTQLIEQRAIKAAENKIAGAKKVLEDAGLWPVQAEMG